MSKTKNKQNEETSVDETLVDAAPAVTVLLKHDQFCSLSHNGISYIADENGVFEIPSEHSSELIELFALTHVE